MLLLLGRQNADGPLFFSVSYVLQFAGLYIRWDVVLVRGERMKGGAQEAFVIRIATLVVMH